MKFFTALSVVTATGALATNHAYEQAGQSSGDSSSSTQGQPWSQPAYQGGAGNWAATSSAWVAEPASVHSTAELVQTSAAMVDEIALTGTTTEAPAYTATMAAPSANAEPKTHMVVVGGAAGLVYEPPSISAEIGDVVHFTFMRQNHTVTQSTFDKPCNKQSADAFDSGFMANINDTVIPAPTFAYTVTSTDPTWWYCRQGNHCGMGMVFAINPTAEKSFDAFKAAAIAINGTAASSTTAPPTATEGQSTVTLVADATSTTLEAAMSTTADVAPPAITKGWNAGSAGTCNCACFCGVGAFPVGDGVGSYGGFGGALPPPW